MRKALVGLLAMAAMLGGAAQPALADPVPESDQVTIQLTGANRAAGSIHWSNLRNGSGSVKVYNDLGDRQCVGLSDRIMVGGVWQPWRSIQGPLCYVSVYTLPVARSSSSNIQYWQFRLKELDTNLVGYDTNRPGFE
ncbi:MAG: hypothetical protein ACR2MO_11835 [Acidimicrobiales bacterium]